MLHRRERQQRWRIKIQSASLLFLLVLKMYRLVEWLKVEDGWAVYTLEPMVRIFCEPLSSSGWNVPGYILLRTAMQIFMVTSITCCLLISSRHATLYHTRDTMNVTHVCLASYLYNFLGISTGGTWVLFILGTYFIFWYFGSHVTLISNILPMQIARHFRRVTPASSLLYLPGDFPFVFFLCPTSTAS